MLQVVIFCHVEPGTVRNREIRFHPGRAEGILEAVPRIVKFAEDVDIPLTFAMTPTALSTSETDLDGHEVGMHLHPQDALLRQALRGSVKLTSDCLAQYPPEDQKTLIHAAKTIFEGVEDRSPSTFVAGNWSENTVTLRILTDAGFRFDGSPLPGHRSACASWDRVSRLAFPYNPSLEDYERRGTADYLYIPVSQGFWNHYLTPENIHHLGRSYFKAALKEAKVGGADLVHIYFHSPMAVDPYFLSEFAPVVEFARDELKARFVVSSDLRAGDRASSRPFPPAYFAYLNWRLAKGFVGHGPLGRRLMSVA